MQFNYPSFCCSVTWICSPFVNKYSFVVKTFLFRSGFGSTPLFYREPFHLKVKKQFTENLSKSGLFSPKQDFGFSVLQLFICLHLASCTFNLYGFIIYKLDQMEAMYFLVVVFDATNVQSLLLFYSLSVIRGAVTVQSSLLISCFHC
jgi:hypothetical protein